MPVNYAEAYSSALANKYGSQLFSGALWNTENKNKYQVIDAKTIKIPVLKVGGRVDGDRTKIGDFTQNFSNTWEVKELKNHRVFQTLVHPQDINQTNEVATIQNITTVMNEQEKFPELDAMMFSTIYSLANAIKAITPESSALDSDKALKKFDAMMDAMDEALVPPTGRILYVDTFTKTLLEQGVVRQVQNGDASINRAIARLDNVDIIGVPTAYLKTAYTFNDGKTAGQTQGGFTPAASAKDIAMILVHPSAILPVANYSFAQIEEPSALSQGKYVYFEESFEDAFLLNERVGAVQICVKP